jgi:putative SOS response-associated peptidase YedK
MCGRFTLKTPPRLVAELFDLSTMPELAPRYNVAPSQPVPVPVAGLRADGRTRGMIMMGWGFVPELAVGPRPGSYINAKSETASELPSFRAAFRERRALVIVDGFYEWPRRPDGRRVPGQPARYFRMADGRPFAFAAIWERWDGGGRPYHGCAILTTGPNELVAPFHDRMPCILHPDDVGLWLDRSVQDPDRVQPLLRPYPPDAMAAVAVGNYVNKPIHEGPRCLEPAA